MNSLSLVDDFFSNSFNKPYADSNLFSNLSFSLYAVALLSSN